MIGDHQRQFHATRLRPLPHPHPTRRQGNHRIFQPPRPAVGNGTRRCEHDRADQVGFRRHSRWPQIAEFDAALPVNLTHRNQRAVQPDWPIPASLPKQRNQALAFAQGVATNDMRPFGKQGDAVQQLADLIGRRRVHEDRQREGRLGDEYVARHGFECTAGRVGNPLVVTADHSAGALIFHGHLRAAQYMPGGAEPDPHVADRDRFMPAQRLL